MTLQETYNTVKDHLLTQGRRARNADDDRCAYRSPDGLKCAVGCLIPDELYDPVIEGTSVEALCESSPEISDFLGANDPDMRDLLRTLQVTHDKYPTEKWGDHLKTVAVDFNLVP